MRGLRCTCIRGNPVAHRAHRTVAFDDTHYKHREVHVRSHNVVEVTLADDQSCNAANPIRVYSTGEDTTIKVYRLSVRFFICGRAKTARPVRRSTSRCARQRPRRRRHRFLLPFIRPLQPAGARQGSTQDGLRRSLLLSAPPSSFSWGKSVNWFKSVSAPPSALWMAGTAAIEGIPSGNI
ncbi:hypothetical protein B296_00001882 [Ensete ventricosum]|uniref:Phytocyanin domain-containing protein n=1 Tax=Ensete ventricosum TaxID=4639 RepID=A0A427AZK8_ENSVE|nr:hypothetical protein B296_00001882 [Ensete ventricosum]